MASALGWLKQFQGLRGGAWDLFGKTAERRTERRLIDDYLLDLHDICAGLQTFNHRAAVALASVPDEVRDDGHVRVKSIADAEALRAQRLNAFRKAATGRTQAVRTPSEAAWEAPVVG